MNKVYIVTLGEYFCYSIDAVFSTKELADSFCQELDKTTKQECDKARIEEHLLDLPREDWYVMKVGMDRDGNIKNLEDIIPYLDMDGPVDYFYNGLLFSLVRTTKLEEAIKVTNEKRTRFLASNRWGINPIR